MIFSKDFWDLLIFSYSLFASLFRSEWAKYALYYVEYVEWSLVGRLAFHYLRTDELLNRLFYDYS